MEQQNALKKSKPAILIGFIAVRSIRQGDAESIFVDVRTLFCLVIPAHEFYSQKAATEDQIIKTMKRDTKKSYTRKQYLDKLSSGSVSARLADIVWLGDSLEVLRGFPRAMQGDLGYALERVQRGQMPPDSKPMQTVGPGVYELRDQDERAWYRVFYLKKIADVIYVLHCFEKRTAQTEKKDIEIARERLKRLNEQRRAKEKSQTGRSPNQGKRS